MANWAYVENEHILETHEYLPKNWKNISNLNASETDLPTLKIFGWYPIINQVLDYDDRTQILEKGEFTFDGNKVIQNFLVKDISTDVLYNDFISKLREQRNNLLKESDFMCLIDIVQNREAQYLTDVTNYRQQLRDLPNLFPNDGSVYDFFQVNYPVKPNLNSYLTIGN
jgi:hypothetical protein